MGSDRERLNATRRAELVLNHMFVEFKFCQIGLARQELELTCRRKPQQGTQPAAS
jgi:hypothetical protein